MKLSPWQEFILEQYGPDWTYDPDTRILHGPDGYLLSTPLRGPRYSDLVAPPGSVATAGMSKEIALLRGYSKFAAWLIEHGYTIADHYNS